MQGKHEEVCFRVTSPLPQTKDTEPKKQYPSNRERSSTELRCAALHSRAIVRDRRRLSIVEMNAPAGALDSSSRI